VVEPLAEIWDRIPVSEQPSQPLPFLDMIVFLLHPLEHTCVGLEQRHEDPLNAGILLSSSFACQLLLLLLQEQAVLVDRHRLPHPLH